MLQLNKLSFLDPYCLQISLWQFKSRAMPFVHITSFKPPTCLPPPLAISLVLSRLVYLTFQQMLEIIPTNILPMNGKDDRYKYGLKRWTSSRGEMGSHMTAVLHLAWLVWTAWEVTLSSKFDCTSKWRIACYMRETQKTTDFVRVKNKAHNIMWGDKFLRLILYISCPHKLKLNPHNYEDIISRKKSGKSSRRDIEEKQEVSLSVRVTQSAAMRLLNTSQSAISDSH